MFRWTWTLAVLALACGNKDGDKSEPELESPPEPATVTAAIGECSAAPGARFESGPSPVRAFPINMGGIGDLSSTTGRIGVIGGGRYAAVGSQIVIGKGNVVGAMDRNVMRRFIRRKLNQFRACYEPELEKQPLLEGALEVEFEISKSGSTTVRSAKGVDAKVDACVANVFKKMRFPSSNGINIATFELAMKPPRKPDLDEGKMGRMDSVRPTGSYAMPAPPPPPPRAALLEGKEAALAKCGQDIELTADLAFAVEVVVADGAGVATSNSGNDELDKCVALAIGPIKTTATPATYQCPVVLGTSELRDLSVIEIKGGAVYVDRRKLPESASSDGTLPALADVLEKRRVAAPDKETVRVSLPMVLRVAPETQNKLVQQVLRTLRAAQVPIEPVAGSVDKWRPLRELSLPRVPVEIGRTPPKAPKRAAILITNQETRVGVGKGKTTVDGALDADAVKQALVGFVAREPVEIELAAAPDVAYGDVVKLIDSLKAAGYDRWVMVEPEAMSIKLAD